MRKTANLQATPLIPIDANTTKVGLAVRTKYLNKLYEEFVKHSIDETLVSSMALAEEKAPPDISQTQAGYTSVLADAVRGIGEKQFTLSTASATNQPLLTVSERMSKKNEGAQIGERQFYEALQSRYLLTNEQLRENGYPLIVKQVDGTETIGIESTRGDIKTFSEDDGLFARYFLPAASRPLADLRRTCYRCNKDYQMCAEGNGPIKAEVCIHHYKRPFERRGATPAEMRSLTPSFVLVKKKMQSFYGCCNSKLTARGCAIGSSHVCRTMRRSEMQQFRPTPPPSGADDPRSQRVYALDCEMAS